MHYDHWFARSCIFHRSNRLRSSWNSVDLTVIPRYNLLCEFQYVPIERDKIVLILPTRNSARKRIFAAKNFDLLFDNFFPVTEENKYCTRCCPWLQHPRIQRYFIHDINGRRFFSLMFAYFLEERDKRCGRDSRGTAWKTFEGTHTHSLV